MTSRRPTAGFAAAVAATLLAAGFSGVMVLLMMLEVDLPGAFGQMTHFQEPHHRVHDLTFGLLFGPSVAGVLVQLRDPSRNVAGMVMALVPPAALLLVVALSVVLTGNASALQPPWVLVGAAALIALSLHPAGSQFFSSFRIARVDRWMLGLLLVAAVPLLVLTVANVRLQGVGDDHAAAGHYGFIAAFGLTVVGVGALASLRPDGWRLTAWVGGLLPGLLGVASLAYPDATSSLDAFWAVAAITWGMAFVAVTERAAFSRPE